MSTSACSASSRAMHSMLKEHLLPGCNVPPSLVVSVVLLYLAIILHPVDELPLYLQPPSDWMKMFGQCVVVLCLWLWLVSLWLLWLLSVLLWLCVGRIVLYCWKELCCWSRTWLHNLPAPLFRTLLLHSMGSRCLCAGLSPSWCSQIRLLVMLLHLL